MQSKLIYTFCIWLTTILYCQPPPLHLWSPVTSSRRVRRWQSVLSRDTHLTTPHPTWSLWSRSPGPQSGHRDLYLWPVGCAEPLLLMSITMARLLATPAGYRQIFSSLEIDGICHRAFFRRAVGEHKKYDKCIRGGDNCIVDVVTRTNCKKCRLKRCFEVWIVSVQ